MNNVYEFLPAGLEAELINESRELVLAYERAEGTPPIFIKLLQEPFHNWIISIEDIKANGNGLAFGYNICRVPKSSTNEMIEELREQLSDLIMFVFNEIIENTVEHDPEQDFSLKRMFNATNH